MTTDTVTISDITLSDNTVTYVDTSGCTSTLTIDTTSPTYSESLISDYSLDITDEKRTSVRDSGELPIDIWAKMYNNGIIDD